VKRKPNTTTGAISNKDRRKEERKKRGSSIIASGPRTGHPVCVGEGKKVHKRRGRGRQGHKVAEKSPEKNERPRTRKGGGGKEAPNPNVGYGGAKKKLRELWVMPKVQGEGRVRTSKRESKRKKKVKGPQNSLGRTRGPGGKRTLRKKGSANEKAKRNPRKERVKVVKKGKREDQREQLTYSKPNTHPKKL